jgi:tetratricopeptide (TPR) repeat protein
VEYLLKAGEKTRRAYLNEAAIGYFQRVLARLKAVECAAEARLEALTGLGRIHFMLGNLDEAEAFFRRAVAAGKEMGLAPRRLARLYHYLGEVFWWQSRYAERIRIGEEGLALLGDDTECVEAALMNDLIAWGSMLLRDFERAREFTCRNRPLLRSLPYEEPLMPAYVHQASAAVELEKNLSARWEWCERLEGAGRACGDWSAVANAQLHMGVWLYAYSGELTWRMSYLQMAREQFAKIGDAKGEATALMRMGRALLALGRLSEAEAASRQGVTVLEALGHKRYAQQAWRTLGIVALCRGEWEHATEAIENDLRLDREAGRTGAYPTYLLGRILLAMRKRAEAVERFYQSAVLGLGSASGLAALEFAGLGLPAVVAAIEDSIEDPDERRRVCQRLREESEVQAGAASIQWELEAAEPDRELPLAEFGREGFRAGDPDAWCLEHGWSWEDPLGDCSLKVSDGIEIRAANGRDLYHLNLTAPRLLRRSDGDPSADPMPAFAMQAACLPACPETPAIGGLLLWKDDQNYLYLERGRQGRFELSFGGYIADRGVTIGRGRLPCECVFLRLERVDRRVRALCSADGEVWFLVGQGEFPADDPLQVGIHAIGAVDRTIYPGAHLDGTAIRFEP